MLGTIFYNLFYKIFPHKFVVVSFFHIHDLIHFLGIFCDNYPIFIRFYALVLKLYNNLANKWFGTKVVPLCTKISLDIKIFDICRFSLHF